MPFNFVRILLNPKLMNLFFRKTGEHGTPIVILHGIFGSSDNWLTVGKMIADAGFVVYVLDQRNHGRSPWSDEFSYEAMAADLMEFIESEGLIQPLIIGHSMGGKIAMQFAMNYPEAFAKMIVVDIAPKFYPIHHDQILKGLNAIDLAVLPSRQAADDTLARYEPNLMVRQFLLKNLYRNPETGQFSWRINLAVLTKEIHTVGNELTNPRVIEKPVLFMRGAESPYVTSEDETVIRQIFPQAQIEAIAGAGHWVQADQPEAFVKAVISFVE